ncbi:hypothetical protein PV433_09570 [Paenibacillus sp. GYB004]|uniref:hypothetical protein n=1 Tax=Paenibacillus sp. GYB004 TaxID=2994393 RepID=UPI002F96A434
MLGKKRAVALSAIAAMTASLLAGCGGKEASGGGAGQGADAAPGTQPAAVQPVKQEPVTITFGYRPGYFTEKEMERYVIRAGEKEISAHHGQAAADR